MNNRRNGLNQKEVRQLVYQRREDGRERDERRYELLSDRSYNEAGETSRPRRRDGEWEPQYVMSNGFLEAALETRASESYGGDFSES